MNGLSAQEKGALQSIFAQVPNIEKAILFGSRAMGLHRYNSDVDIALYGEDITTKDILRLHALVEETTMPYMFDFVVPGEDNLVLIEEIKQHGRVFYEKND